MSCRRGSMQTGPLNSSHFLCDYPCRYQQASHSRNRLIVRRQHAGFARTVARPDWEVLGHRPILALVRNAEGKRDLSLSPVGPTLHHASQRSPADLRTNQQRTTAARTDSCSLNRAGTGIQPAIVANGLIDPSVTAKTRAGRRESRDLRARRISGLEKGKGTSG